MLPIPTTDPRTRPSSSGQRPVEDPDTVLARLRDLEARHTHLNIRLDNEPDFFSSQLMRLDPGHGWLFLEELTPYQGHLRVAPGRTMQVYTLLDGMPLHFKSPVLHTGEHDDTAFYVVGLPESMDDEQKRTHFRTRLADKPHVELVIRDRDGGSYPGRLEDLSLGGLRALLPVGTPIGSGDLLQVEDLTLPGEPPIRCGLQVRCVREDRALGGLIVGGRFFDLGEQEAQRILRELLRLERDHHHLGDS
ncbi:MAG: flagellar brake protein [Ectothiorhodospira sp.]